jgi:coenzyme F420-dependent glucose-6-phosphate dehydrogenase
MDATIRISSSTDQHAEWIAKDIELGFQKVILHNINTNQEEFINVFADEVLPQLR